MVPVTVHLFQGVTFIRMKIQINMSHKQIVPCSHEADLTIKLPHPVTLKYSLQKALCVCMPAWVCICMTVLLFKRFCRQVDSSSCHCTHKVSTMSVSLPRVREAAMTSLMDVTMLVASSAPEILLPDLWVAIWKLWLTPTLGPSFMNFAIQLEKLHTMCHVTSRWP